MYLFLYTWQGFITLFADYSFSVVCSKFMLYSLTLHGLHDLECVVCVCVFVHIIMCVCVCVLVCVCSCMQACVCVSVFMHASMCV